jgi:hypothetical protein
MEQFGLTDGQIINELSRYAAKDSYDFVAEGLAEFLDSKTRRRLARKIGELVSAYIGDL